LIKLIKVIFICFWLAFANGANAASLRVAVLTDDAQPFKEFVQLLQQEISRQSLPLTLISSSTVPESADFILAVGIQSATLALHSRLPVMSVLVSKASVDPLLSHQPKKNSSVIYLDQPLWRQVALIEAIFPHLQKIGILNAENSPDRTELKQLVQANKLKLLQQTVTAELPLANALELLLPSVEVLLALPDTVIYSSQNIRFILLSAYRNRIPLIGFSKNYVAAGALAAVFSTPTQIATQTAATLAAFANSGSLAGVQYPQDFEVLMNAQVARALNIPLQDPAELKKHLKLRAISGGGGLND
jgi:ABC-type uncharacterized transport system substrate-binding protein